MNKKITLICLILTLFLSFGNAFAGIIGLRAVDSSITGPNGAITVQPSTVFDVELYFSGLSDILEATGNPNNGLVGYNLDIIWDPLVELQNVSPGDWGMVDSIPKPSQLPAVPADALVLTGYNFAAPFVNDHVMATLRLQCLGAGITELMPKFTFEHNDVNLALADLSYIANDLVELQGITINQTPIPGAVWLLGSGLAGLVAIRRKKNNK